MAKKDFNKLLQSILENHETSQITQHLCLTDIDNIFEIFDDDDTKSLGFREFLCCFSVLLRGTIQEKVDIFIKMHDVEKKGYFYKSEVEKTIDHVCQLLKLSFPPEYL